MSGPIVSEQPSQIAAPAQGASASQASIHQHDSFKHFVLLMLFVTLLGVFLSYAVWSAIDRSIDAAIDAKVAAELATKQSKDTATEARLMQMKFMELQASLVARGIQANGGDSAMENTPHTPHRRRQ